MSVSLSDRIHKQPPRNGKFYLIAIDGRGGAGKSTLTEYIDKLLPDFAILNGDEYFEHDDTTIAFGSFNNKRFHEEVVKPLQQGATSFVYHPYDWHKKPHFQDKRLVIKKGLIVERSFSFNFDLDYDLKIWVETPAKLALQRGQDRDEMPLEQGYRSWKEVWQPQENAHFEKVKPLETADIVIDGTKPFEEQLV